MKNVRRLSLTVLFCVALCIDVVCILIAVVAFLDERNDRKSFTLPAPFKKMAVQVPPGIIVTEPTASSTEFVLKLEVEHGKGKMVIFDIGDFNGDGPRWIFPKTDERTHQWLPTLPTEEKDFTVGTSTYRLWLYYDTTDTSTKDTLENIAQSAKEFRDF